jgi:hypothetical protein
MILVLHLWSHHVPIQPVTYVQVINSFQIPFCMDLHFQNKHIVTKYFRTTSIFAGTKSLLHDTVSTLITAHHVPKPILPLASSKARVVKVFSSKMLLYLLVLI